MNTEIYIGFVLSSLLMTLLPGPTVLFVIAQSMRLGKTVTVPLVLGVVSGDAILILISSLGIAFISNLSQEIFQMLRYLAALYLIYKGLTTIIKSLMKNSQKKNSIQTNIKKHKIFMEAFIITAINPKGIIFFITFFPLFININGSVNAQIVLLSTTFIIIAIFVHSTYSILSHSLSRKINTQSSYIDRISGLILLVVGSAVFIY
ncbi:LysE family translocator [Arcobacteraceae bacterium]|nr:LysE family translocator [Arcobacteraceae bacterium]